MPLVTIGVFACAQHGEIIRLAAQERHDKQALRIAALAAMEAEGCVDAVHDTFMRTLVKLNFKKDEWAKPGKNGRIVCDMSTPASIRGGWLCSIIKEAWTTYTPSGARGRSRFVLSPNRDVLRDVFRELSTSDFFVYHSDDSCLSLRCSDGMLWCNLDISSCDASNGAAIFEALLILVPDCVRPIVYDMLEQCKSLAQLGHGASKMVFAPVGYFEYSGTTLTTLLNNIANIIIGHQLLECPYGTIADSTEWVQERLRFCGWFCTIEVCRKLEGIQFLKNSPHFTTDGQIESCLNLGVMLRALGQKCGTIPGGMTPANCHLFNCSLVRGFVHAGTHALTVALRNKFSADAEAVHTNATLHLSGSDTGYVTAWSLCNRYSGVKIDGEESSMTEEDLQYLIELIERSQYGSLINCRASRMILKLDYGL